ncbi:hypothetical protein [Endozoicomonas sp. SESOKO2]|uniref:hypothetical protein n=1 Tax=Endozoicomonas sp. SESOKO2 TaxID=2828743 RepID=UPI002147EA9B|nr:hypothetical protein [Endozoicomonas sp. SESOKO2]
MKGKQLAGRYFTDFKVKKALQGIVVIGKIADDFQTLPDHIATLTLQAQAILLSRFDE